jgi:uncharacterized protein (DUF849 family)
MKDTAGKVAFVTGGLGRDRSIEWFWARSGIGSPAEIEALLRAAIVQGGHVRVGIGDNPSACAGKTNQTVVAEAVAIAAELGREPGGANATGLLS